MDNFLSVDLGDKVPEVVCHLLTTIAVMVSVKFEVIFSVETQAADSTGPVAKLIFMVAGHGVLLAEH